MARNVKAAKRGWLYDSANSRLNVYVDGTLVAHYAKAKTKFIGSIADGSFADGYGAMEFDVTMTGTATGHFAATSAWVNIPSGTTPASGGDTITPRTDGIWEDVGATLSGANLAFGARMQAILGDSDFNRLTIWSLNTTKTITAVYDAASPAAYIGFAAGSPSGSATGTIPFFIDSNGTKWYIWLYDNP